MAQKNSKIWAMILLVNALVVTAALMIAVACSEELLRAVSYFQGRYRDASLHCDAPILGLYAVKTSVYNY